MEYNLKVHRYPAPARNIYGFLLKAVQLILIMNRLPVQTQDSLYVLHTAAAFLRTAFAACLPLRDFPHWKINCLPR